MLIEVLRDSLSSVNNNGPARFIFVTAVSTQMSIRLMQMYEGMLVALGVSYKPVRTKRKFLIGMTAVCFVSYKQTQEMGFDDGLDKKRISYHHDHYYESNW